MRGVTKRCAAAAVACLLMVPSLSWGQIFTDRDFLASGYTTSTNNPSRSDIRFNFNYSSFEPVGFVLPDFLTVTLPEAPNTPVGATATTGVFMTANAIPDGNGAATFSAIMPTGVNVGAGTANPNYKVSIDVFHSTGAGFFNDLGERVGLSGTTNQTVIGVNQANTTVQLRELNQPVGDNLTGQGLHLAVTADGGAAEDYLPVYGGAIYIDRAGTQTPGREYRSTTTAPVDTGLASKHIQDYWIANGFHVNGGPGDEDPAADANDLNVFTGDSLYYSPDPANPSAFNATLGSSFGSETPRDVSIFAQSFGNTQTPIHYSCGAAGGGDCGQGDTALFTLADSNDGGIPAGIASNRWSTHELYWIDSVFTYVIDGTPVLQKTANSSTIFDDYSDVGTVLLGFWDRFASIASSPDGANFVVYDNLVVEAAASGDAPDMGEYLRANGFLPSDALVGDYNEDGVVDAADYTVWRDAGGNAGPLGAQGYTDWAGNYGATSAPATASIPEPTAAVLAALGVLAAVRRR